MLLQKLFMAAVFGVLACLAGLGDARAEFILHACTSCELDEGGTGVALKNHVRGQLQAGHSVAVVLMNFHKPNAIGKPIEAALTDLIGSTTHTEFDTNINGAFSLDRSTLRSLPGTLYIYRITPPSDAAGAYVDQEQDIVHDLRLVPSMQYTVGAILNRVMETARTQARGLYFYQMHVYWNMVLEKELATQLRQLCNVSSSAPAQCLRIPVAMWAHSDENAYSGKQPDEKKLVGRIRASVLLKDMINLSDAVFTVSTPSRDQFLNETDWVGADLATLNDETIGKGPFFSLRAFDPKNKDVLVPFTAEPPELCNPLVRSDALTGCAQLRRKYVLPVFNGIAPPATGSGTVNRRDVLNRLAVDFPTGPDWTKLHAVDATLPQSFRNTLNGIGSDDKIVVSVGRINASKNPAALVAKWNWTNVPPGTHLIIAGPPEPDSPESVDYFVELRKAIDAANLRLKDGNNPKKFIHYIGPVSPPGELYAIANVFVSPSKAETQGMTVLEAMAVGTPVVANAAVPSYAEFVFDPSIVPAQPGRTGDAQRIGNGFLDDPDAPGFYAKIRQILTTPGLPQKLSVRGKKTFSYYSIDGIAARTNWAMAAVWARLNTTTAAVPLVETTKVTDWTTIMKD